VAAVDEYRMMCWSMLLLVAFVDDDDDDDGGGGDDCGVSFGYRDEPLALLSFGPSFWLEDHSRNDLSCPNLSRFP